MAEDRGQERLPVQLVDGRGGMRHHRGGAEPPASAHDDADLRLNLGLALAADLNAEAPQALQEAVENADSVGQRSAIALRGARAMGLAGHTGKAVELCRTALADPAGASPEMLTRIEAELVTNAWLQASTHAEARQRLRHPVVEPPPLRYGASTPCCHCLSPSRLKVTAALGGINTPGFMIPAGSS
jgi:hypothetical protein